jgi:hypothetical protein
MRTTPEITADSPFGMAIAEQVGRCTGTIVEIGTGSGLGSTQVILSRLRPEADDFITIEGDPKQFDLASDNLRAFNDVSIVRGTVTRALRPFFHPDSNPAFNEMWRYESVIAATAPLIDDLPFFIDFLLLDGGEFTTDGDFLNLWERSSIIALDDCNPAKSVKTIYAKTCLERAGWTKLSGSDDDRNGWAIFERP